MLTIVSQELLGVTMNLKTDPQGFIPLSNLAFQVLVALADEDRHGYAIIKDIEERTASGLSVRSGALYTVLQRLLEDGLIDNADVPEGEREGDKRRKYYRITPLGHQVASLEGMRLASMVDAAQQRRLIPEREGGR